MDAHEPAENLELIAEFLSWRRLEQVLSIDDPQPSNS